MTYREEFTIPNPLKPIQKAATTAGSGIKTAAKTTAKGATSAATTVKNTALSPVANFFKNIWDKFKYFVSLLCCVCILSSCFFLGIPQMAWHAIAQSSQST